MSNNLVENPLFGAVIGRVIGNNAHAEAAAIRSSTASIIAQRDFNDLSNHFKNIDLFDSDLTCAIAGVRGVTRELLEELRRADPKNPLLDKKVRDRIFLSASSDVDKKVVGKNYLQRNDLRPQWRDETFGAEGSNCGGPDEDKISPNIRIRAEAQVPEHIPERESFLKLIEKLATDLKLANPNAVSLQDQVLAELRQ